jgi:hypothetical protein
MASTNEGDEPQAFHRHLWARALSTIQMIADTMRAEFGDSIDAHPGGSRVEAGTMNRALRISAWVILVDVGNEGDDSSAVQGWVLREVALGRLYDLGLIGPRAETLLDQEPGLRDAWLAYIALAPATVIDDLMGQVSDR